MILAVRLTPKSSRDEIAGIEDHGGECVLKARVRAIPEAGRANAALETLIARWLGVPPSTVSVAHGGKSRLKQVAVAGDAEALSRLIAQRVAELATLVRHGRAQSRPSTNSCNAEDWMAGTRPGTTRVFDERSKGPLDLDDRLRRFPRVWRRGDGPTDHEIVGAGGNRACQE